jgi:hypothetical protein
MKSDFVHLLIVLGLSVLGLTPGLAWTQEKEKGKKPPEPVWGPATEGYRLSLRSSQTDYRKGEKISLEIVLQNAASNDGKVVVSHPLRHYNFDVVRADGTAVPMTPKGKKMLEAVEASHRDVQVLKPGEQTVEELDVSKVFDLTLAGEYRIKVSCAVWNRADRKKFSTVTSNTLTIKITEPSKNKEK